MATLTDKDYIVTTTSSTNYITTDNTTLNNWLTTTQGGITVTPYIQSDTIYNGWDYTIIKNEILKELNEEKGKDKMANNFGPYSNNNLRLSPYGIAIKNKDGKYISYNKETGRLVDVDIFNIEIDSSKIFYRIPKALKEIEIGNLIIHNGELVFVEDIEDARIEVINPVAGTVMKVIPTTSPFGYDYIDTVISLADYLPIADEDNPWGSLLPFMMMGKNNSILAMIMAMGKDLEDINPMMLLAASGDNALLMFALLNKKKKKRNIDDEKIYKAVKTTMRPKYNKEDIDE